MSIFKDLSNATSSILSTTTATTVEVGKAVSNGAATVASVTGSTLLIAQSFEMEQQFKSDATKAAYASILTNTEVMDKYQASVLASVMADLEL